MLGELKGDERRGDPAHAGEKGVHAHIFRHPRRRRELGNPQVPDDLPVGRGRAEDHRAQRQASCAGAGEEREDAKREAGVEDDAHGEEVHPVEQAPPQRREH